MQVEYAVITAHLWKAFVELQLKTLCEKKGTISFGDKTL